MIPRIEAAGCTLFAGYAVNAHLGREVVALHVASAPQERKFRLLRQCVDASSLVDDGRTRASAIVIGHVVHVKGIAAPALFRASPGEEEESCIEADTGAAVQADASVPYLDIEAVACRVVEAPQVGKPQ